MGTAPSRILELVEQFHRNRDEYRKHGLKKPNCAANTWTRSLKPWDGMSPTGKGMRPPIWR